ncbi:hypothetical protein SAY86_002890 [Trapa natans]|uniref:GDSL esterase/lipase n=1 Tax=Trapa natans TaxID=22666 RepID=A0AAN7LUN3_TRANT|nr:hypothetical protein SAY86_002890 [Trapa natans]
MGGSTSDTGNYIRIVGQNSKDTISAPKFLGLSLLNPSLARNSSFKHGANFAVAGSTVLNSSFYKAKNVTIPAINRPLRAQLQWLRSFLNPHCKSPSDYGKSIREVRNYVPYVVKETIQVTRARVDPVRIIQSDRFWGLPIGCAPRYLFNFKSNHTSAYDHEGCLKAFNHLVKYCNKLLRSALASLRREFPRATVLYGDYYGGYQHIFRSGSHLGFDRRSRLKACMGSGPPGVPVCLDPRRFISWDGLHLTQEAHRQITKFILKKISRKLIPFQSLILSCCSASPKGPLSLIETVYQLGDSTADAGNLIRITGSNSEDKVSARLPYGETLGKPTGRFSDGLLIVDYISKALGLPLLNPSLARNRSFEHGANFAVGGSTVLNSSFYKAKNVAVPATNTPLRAQLQWLRSFLNSTCKSLSDCAERLRRSLVIVGEMGSNDFFLSFLQGKSIREVRTYVPYVVQETIQELIQLGLSKVIVFGDYPIGCGPIYLSNFKSNDSSAYDDDDDGCLLAFNDFVQYRNNLVRSALASLRREFPRATVLFGDYYGGYQHILRNGSHLGFDRSSRLKACCGTGGPYNVNIGARCGSPGIPVCPDPSRFISWDGLHLTQEAHRRITEFILEQISPGLIRAT